MPDTREPPIFWEGEPEEHTSKIALTLREVLAGKTNNYFGFTLTPNDTETVIEKDRVNADSVVLPIPTTPSAAAAFASGSFWIEVTYGRIRVHHDSQPDEDRRFRAVVVG